MVAAVAAVPVLLVTLQIVASHKNFEGPLVSLWRDYVGTPKSISVPWAGLALALVGLNWKWRGIALGAAVGIDVVFATARLLVDGNFALGNGPTIVLTAIGIGACWGWRSAVRRGADTRPFTTALHAAALGALLALATKVGDVWLHITILAGPTVLDPYVLLADHALGDPAWFMGQLVDALGPVVYAVLHWVYIELPVAAMVVAAWQLRGVVTHRVWPDHYLVRTFLLLGLVGPVVYVLFPVVGPMFAYGPDGNGLQIGNYWPQLVPPMEQNPAPMPFDNATPRNCMPSMHTAWAMAIFVHTRRDNNGAPAPRWLRWGGTFWLAATLTATLGFGYHYGVDLVAGAVLCLTIESVLRAPDRGWGWFRVRLVAGGAALLAGLLLAYRFLPVTMAESPVIAGALVLGSFAAFVTLFYRTWFAAAVPSESRQVVTVRG
ncbi:phosphatase PAP2 family protein [Nocardia uniformis]|uniref:phosphatase PAP2 family protein n=1 Tax=Nocardia uniformis TaxID=53432 RepID=UPI000B19B99D|nr:phosphatase PAP2 family protein [Nocardia uniformis]